MSVNIQVAIEDASSVQAYSSVPIAFEVVSVFDVDLHEETALAERVLEKSYIKDYDVLWGDGPLEWPNRFDIGDWSFLAAYVDGKRVGGAVLIMNAPDIDMLEGRDDLALLWDFRVSPRYRSHGIGTALMTAIQALALDLGAREIKVETQNINVPACRFYEAQGFELKFANAHAYPDLPHEVQLLWYKSL